VHNLGNTNRPKVIDLISVNDGAAELALAGDWWQARRRRYNVALVKAGLLAFVCYCGVVFWGDSIGAIPDADITLFTILFQGIGYLFMMAVANICYSLGPLSERIVQPRNVVRYRRITFRLGFWFAVLLPFCIPGALAILCVLRPK
jgi:hypothetical protein